MANFPLLGLSSLRLRSRVCELMSRGCIMRTEMTARARRRVGFAMVVLCCVFGGQKARPRHKGTAGVSRVNSAGTRVHPV